MKIPDELLFRNKAKLPVMMSTELAECGLACLAMIAVYHGHDIDLQSLRQRFSISMSGASLRGLMKLADHFGLSSRALRVELGALGKVALPAIIHWDMNHYVVLKSVDKNSVVIHDPTRGKVSISLEEVSNHFTGVVLELSPAAHFEKISDRTKFKVASLFSNIRGLKLGIFYVLFLSIALQVISVVLPFQMQFVVDDAIEHNDIGILYIVVLSFGALTILYAVISALRNWTLQLLGSQMVFQIAGNIFRHLIRLSAGFFEKRHLGDVLSRLGSIRQIQDVLTQGMLSAVIDGSIAIFSGVVLFIYSPMMAAIIFTTVFVFALITIFTYPILKKQTERSITASAKEQSYLMESIRGVVAVKLMGHETVRESSWRNLFGRSFNESVGVVRIQQTLKFTEGMIFGLQYILILYLGAANIIKSQGFSVGMLYSFLAFRSMFTERVLILIDRGLQFSMLALYFERLGDFLSEAPEVKPGVFVNSEIGGPIILKDMSFRYGATDPFILKGINLEINQGDFIAITGPTGGGKTTLLKILLGLQNPTEGHVLLNGERAYPELWQAWRSEISVVRQDDQLFSGTLAENISFFDPDLDMVKVREAAKNAHVHDDIDKMPMKYLTLVGDMGSSLSGGQKQRILLARALYRSPKILVLDEGTANLDLVTEGLIADMIAQMQITRIVVAHRPALLERASRVVKIDNGVIETIR